MTDLELAAYLDHALGEPERSRVEEHLAGCAECREELVQTKNFLERVNRPRRILKISAALAAAVAVFFVVNPSQLHRGPRDDLTRSESASGVAVLVAYGPVGEVSGTRRFVWGATPGALSYRFTLSENGGHALYTTSVPDTSVVLPGSIHLQAGETYYWIVDGLANDGRTPSTGLKEFTIRP